ncbi:MAG: pilin glycosylation ligase domain-containing protein, partial [Oceanospirillaceae bacterium]|nr:pilin glycosylation ligase domain-containing protein [Oceanospirillaceae bacterium]
MLVGTGLFALISTKTWVIPQYFLMIGIWPLLIIFGGFVSGMERPGEWVVRLGVLIGGVFLWFSLLQLQFKRRDVDSMLYLLLAGFLLHAVVGLVQSLPEPILRGWLPISNNTMLGMFQQPNLQASLMSTTVAVALYLAVTPGFVGQHWPMKTLVFLTLALASFEVVASGSRVGLLSALLVVL